MKIKEKNKFRDIPKFDTIKEIIYNSVSYIQMKLHLLQK